MRGQSYLRIHAHIKRSISKHTEATLGIVDLRKKIKEETVKEIEEEAGRMLTCIDDIPKSIKMPSTPPPEERSICLRSDLMCLKLLRKVKAWK